MSNMIVAPQPVAVEEGAKALMQGGNAIDIDPRTGALTGGADTGSGGMPLKV
ncbi:MAG: hypothetical protein JXA89_15975 [Anaerolineae bacterium]|nr:hypothetical protein [Anaerolineae bacterium]